MKGKWNIVLAGMAGALAMGMPVMAEEFVTADQVLKLQTPDKEWKQVEDQDTWVTLAKGNDRITILHLSNGEQLPSVAVADDTFARVCQSIISTKDEVFIITGSVAAEEDFAAVQDAVESVEILTYGTKTAAAPQASAGSQSGSISSVSFDGYVTTNVGLNVRSSSDAGSSVLGTLGYGQQVKVTGLVKNGSTDTGWYQISYNGGTGYVSAQYLSDKKPGGVSQQENQGQTEAQSQAESHSAEQQTNQTVTLYSVRDGSSVNLFPEADGTLIDGAHGIWSKEGNYWKSNLDTILYQEEPIGSIGDYVINNADHKTLFTSEDGTETMWVYYNPDTGLNQTETGEILTPQWGGLWLDEQGNGWVS